MLKAITVLFFMVIFFTIQYIWRKKRAERKITDYFHEKGFSVLKIEGSPMDLLSQSYRGVFVVVIQRGREEPRCCQVDTAHFKGLSWSYSKNRRFCEKCRSVYNTDEYSACPDCFTE